MKELNWWNLLKIVVLPVKQASKDGGHIWKGVSSNKLLLYCGADEEYVPQHLYLVSNREINVDDWYIDDRNNVRQAVVDDKEYWKARVNYRKIESTTDVSLNIKKIPASFVERYVMDARNQVSNIAYVGMDRLFTGILDYRCKNGHYMNKGFENLTCTYPHCGELIKAEIKGIVYEFGLCWHG